jgi:hypothetical protein
MRFFKTVEVSRMLQYRYENLFNLIRNGQLTPPAKDSSGDYIWLASDIDRARRAIAALQKRKLRREPATAS